MITKKMKSVLLVVLLLMTCSVKFFALENAISFTNTEAAQSYFKIPGASVANIHAVKLTITCTGGTPDKFYINYQDGTNDVINVGDQFNTDITSPYGNNIALEETGTPNEYLLTIAKNAVSPAVGYFTVDEIWGLTVISSTPINVSINDYSNDTTEIIGDFNALYHQNEMHIYLLIHQRISRMPTVAGGYIILRTQLQIYI